MKNIVDYILESKDTLKELLDNLAAYQWKSEMKGWRFKKDTYKTVKKGRGEFKISIKDAEEYINGKDGSQGQYTTNIYVYLKGFDFEDKQYISIICKSEDSWNGAERSQDFCVLNSIDGIDPFIKWSLKPHRNKTKSDIGPDGELKLWLEKMPKTYTPEIKPYVCDKRTAIKIGDLVKIQCVE